MFITTLFVEVVYSDKKVCYDNYRNRTCPRRHFQIKRKENKPIMLNAEGVNNGEYLEYKGRPLVRHDSDIYYGDLSAKYHVHMIVMSEKEIKGTQVPDKIVVQLVPHGAIMPEKNIMSTSLIDALETADAWLERRI